MSTFHDFNIPESILKLLDEANLTTPTPVQEKTLPLSLAGEDILASAQTGTGKTLAFLIPVVTRMLENPESNALILAPTRELAVQVKDAAVKLIKTSSLRAVSLIGGEAIGKQLGILSGEPPRRPMRGGRFAPFSDRKKVDPSTHKGYLMIGTPGRINDHLKRGSISLDSTHFLVLDETDRMLDLGFADVLEEILGYLPQERQTLMFSATMPRNITKLADKYLNNPKRVDIEKIPENAPKIKQSVVKYRPADKFENLLKQLEGNEGSAIIFVKTKMGSEELSSMLEEAGHASRAIHGDLKQRDRDFVIKNVKSGRIKVMVATDVAARGLHIPEISLVINYDLPGTKEDYTHRIGRTGRAGREGIAVSFVNEHDRKEQRIIAIYMRSDDDEESEREAEEYKRNYSTPRRRAGGFGGRRDFGGRNERSGFGSEREGGDYRPREPREPREGRGFGGGRSSGFFGGKKKEQKY